MKPSKNDVPIAIIGSGSWGTALAFKFSLAGRKTLLWGRNKNCLNKMIKNRENKKYLPNVKLPESLIIETCFEKCINEATYILVATPSHAFRHIISLLKKKLTKEHRICWGTKGFESQTGKLPHQIIEELLGTKNSMAVLSGPSFAVEVGRKLPTAVTIASNNKAFSQDLATSLSDEHFRAYTAEDIIGVEVGGATKNVVAIGAGISDGLGFGKNARIALINRGLAEMTRLGVELGASKETFMGLSGMGDLVLTCTSDISRNRQMGLALAKGKTIKEAQQDIQQVVEGLYAAEAVWKLANEIEIEMPICKAVYKILYKNISPREVAQSLMLREIRTE